MIINAAETAADIGSAAHTYQPDKNSLNLPPFFTENSPLTGRPLRRSRHAAGGDYPCLCLCFGFSQITLMRPFLLMILHFSQIGFTDDLTFTLNPPFKKDRFLL